MARRKLSVITKDDPATSQTTDLRAEFQLDCYIPFLINRVATTMLRYSSGEFERLGLTVPAFRILTVLRQENPCRFGRLAEVTSIEQPSLSRYIRQLSARKLIRRRRDPNDSRSVFISLTPLGREHIDLLLPSALVMGDQILEGMTESEERVLRQALKRIYSNLERFGRAWNPNA